MWAFLPLPFIVIFKEASLIGLCGVLRPNLFYFLKAVMEQSSLNFIVFFPSQRFGPSPPAQQSPSY